MNRPDNPGYCDNDYEGCVTAGRATGFPIPSPSDEDLRRAEEAWSDLAFYDFVKDEPVAAAGWMPKPVVDPSCQFSPTEVGIELAALIREVEADLKVRGKAAPTQGELVAYIRDRLNTEAQYPTERSTFEEF